MRVAGNLKKEGKWWAVEIPLLDLDTQGATKAEAYAMAKDVVETMVNKEGFEVTVIPVGPYSFIVDAPDTKTLMSFILERRRLAIGLSASEVARRMGQTSPTGYERYAKGLSQPSVEKFFSILKVMDAETEPVLTIIQKTS